MHHGELGLRDQGIGQRGRLSLIQCEMTDVPAGGSAQSPPTCVDAAYPTVRFFASGTGTMAVGVVYHGVYLPAGVAVVLGGWQPTPLMLTSSALPAAIAGGTTDVSLVLTTLTGNLHVDDDFIDPWNRG